MPVKIVSILIVPEGNTRLNHEDFFRETITQHDLSVKKVVIHLVLYNTAER